VGSFGGKRFFIAGEKCEKGYRNEESSKVCETSLEEEEASFPLSPPSLCYEQDREGERKDAGAVRIRKEVLKGSRLSQVLVSARKSKRTLGSEGRAACVSGG